MTAAQLDQNLIMPDERIHKPEGGLKEREAIGGLFRNVKEYLCTTPEPLSLCWEPLSRQ